MRQFSTTVPGTCTEAGIPPTTIYFCNANEATVTATCEAGEVPIYASGGAPEPVGGAPTGFKIPVIAGPGTAAGPTTIPVSSTLLCAKP